MASPLPAQAHPKEPNVPLSRQNTRPLTPASHDRKVSVIYGKKEQEQSPRETITTRPRDAAIKLAANNNRKTVVTYKASNDNYTNYPSVSEEFNESYDQAGLQPSVGSSAQYRNVGVEREPAQQRFNSAPSSRTLNRTTKQSQEASALKQTNRAIRQERQVAKAARGGFKHPKKAIVGALPGGDGMVGDLVNRVLATEISIAIISAAGTAWMAFQIPLALVSLAAFGAAIALDAAYNAAHGNFVTGALWDLGSYLLEGINSIATELFGVDLSLVLPDRLLILTQGVTMLFGWATLLIIGLVYLIVGIPSVFGEKGSGVKIGTLLLAMIGYALPILNLLPWFGVWVFAVWLYPE